MDVQTPQQRVEHARRLARQVVREPFQSRAWAELGFFLVSSALASLAVIVVALLGFVGLALTVVVAGVAIVALSLQAARGLGRWQRLLAGHVLGEVIPDPEPLAHRPGLFAWIWGAITDWVAWRAVVYFIVKIPLAIFGVWFALSVWLEAFFGLASAFAGARGSTSFGAFGGFVNIHSSGGPRSGLATHLAALVVGAFLLFLAPWPMRLVVYLDRLMMHLLLGPGATASRLKSLQESRSKTLDVATATLRRIERDLHDGTQAQLVALAMRLGQAKEKLDVLAAADQTGEIVNVRQLVADAHRETKEAITDLRDLARGIHPPALDTGLENALATLAARNPVPTTVTVSIQTRPDPVIETISYFCAAELLANVAQHAHARRASLSCAEHGPWLRIAVRDDGSGGAAVNRLGSSSSGLAGLADRVATVDGHLSIASPTGGPTSITVDLPIHS